MHLLLALLACNDADDPTGAGTSGTSTSTSTSTETSGEDDLFADAASMTDLVDPFIGTGGSGAEVTGVSPGASAPNGLTLVAPDTRHSSLGAPTFLHLGGYHYDDDLISGIAHTRGHGIGIHDYGAVQVMARGSWSDDFTNPHTRSAPFDHEDESARPGSYAVTLQDDGTEVQVVASLHGAHHRYTFAPNQSPVLVLDLGHGSGLVEVADDTWARADGATVEGMQRLLGGYSDRFGGLMNHFAMRLDPAPIDVSGWVDPAAVEARTEVSGATSGLVLHFPEGTTEVDLRVALSYTDVAGAWTNLDAELPDLDLESRRAEVDAQWRERLDRIQVVGGSDEDQVVFATALYHTLLMPSRMDDADGRYRGIDGDIHTADGPVYSDFSLWDTFRTLHPWYLLAWPDLQRDCLRSLERMVDDGGALPRWPMAHGPTGGMVGTPAAQVVAESWLKGLRDGYDAEKLWDAAFVTSTGPVPYAGRNGLDEYQQMGFVPVEASGGSTSRTLEYAWSDASLAAWGAAMGRPETELRPLLSQSGSWRNVWDAETGFFRGRYADGSFDEMGSEHAWSDEFVEGNAWHYVWYVPFDVPSMIDVQHGGDTDAFLQRLSDYWDEVEAEEDDAWPDAWYWHGNEPVLHYAALASLAGDRALSVRAADLVAEQRYDATPRGLDGNDDAGTLSAWYLWTSLGLYPVAGFDRYAVLSPRFEGVRIRRDDGDVVVLGEGRSDEVFDVEPLDGGEPLEEVSHADLLGGLRFR